MSTETVRLTSCPLCGATPARLKRIMKGQYRVWICGRCTLSWVDRDDLATAPEEAVYSGYAWTRVTLQHFERMKPLYLKGFQERVRHGFGAKSPEEMAFLDVGCANGEYLWAAKEAGFGSISGVEIDATAANAARAYGEVTETLGALTCRQYDVVQIKNVLGNISDFAGMLATCVGSLKEGGVIFVDVLNQNSLAAVFRQLIYGRVGSVERYGCLRPPYVINGFNRRSLRALLERCGLRPLRMATAAQGSKQLPYFARSKTAFIGDLAAILGAGAMLVSDSTRNGRG
jgi:SAM-dependent methyltransferase